MARKKTDRFESWRQHMVDTVSKIQWPTQSTYRRNAEGLLHCEAAPAIETPQMIAWYENGRPHGRTVDRAGSVLYYHRGIVIPQRFAEHPETITFADVMAQKNAEVRFVTMRLFGFERALREKHLEIVGRYEDTVNDYLLLKPVQQMKGFEFQLVRVLNNTPDPDGTYKPYFLVVPPDMNDAYAAVAWTFRRTAETYRPCKQT